MASVAACWPPAANGLARSDPCGHREEGETHAPSRFQIRNCKERVVIVKKLHGSDPVEWMAWGVLYIKAS
jgi:hypothetical protein